VVSRAARTEGGDGLSAVGRPTVDAANGIIYVGTDAGIFYAVELPIP
jgi:hypothetical protein